MGDSYVRIPVSPETRRELRQRKAADGRSYDQYIREEFLNDE